MTTKLQNAIIVGSIIGSILSEYSLAESKKPIEILKKRIKKMMFNRSLSNYEEFKKAIKIADEVWKDTVNHFAEKNIAIVATTTILNLYTYYDDALKRFANIGDKQIESYLVFSGHTSLTLEQNSYVVSDYLLDKLEVFSGVEKRVFGGLQ